MRINLDTTLFRLTDRNTAEKRWTEWFNAAKASEIPALVKFAELKEKRLPGLIAHAEYNISTGKLEGFNNKIKVSKRIGYGYRDDAFFSCSSSLFHCNQSNIIPHKSVENQNFYSSKRLTHFS